MKSAASSNERIASALEQIAELLQAQDSDPFRVRAYRNAARSIGHRTEPVAALADDLPALVALPTVGKTIAQMIAELVHTGRAELLDRLRGEVSPEDLFTRIPGIGDTLASLIHRELHLETLEELELAASDGRLAQLPGIGSKRIAAIQNGLRSLLGLRRVPDADNSPPLANPPSVTLLLEIDQLYREKATAGQLKKISPKRFNPDGKAWLPILHVDRRGWHLTVLFSNTERAHILGKTNDWVIIFSERRGVELQSTVVTEHHGRLAGKRVVRGREDSCLFHYQQIGAIGAHLPPKPER